MWIAGHVVAEMIGDLGLPAEALTQVTAAVVPAAYSAAVEQLAEAHQISPVLLEAQRRLRKPCRTRTF